MRKKIDQAEPTSMDYFLHKKFDYDFSNLNNHAQVIILAAIQMRTPSILRFYSEGLFAGSRNTSETRRFC
jgi:hypothetical protein